MKINLVYIENMNKDTKGSYIMIQDFCILKDFITCLQITALLSKKKIYSYC